MFQDKPKLDFSQLEQEVQIFPFCCESGYAILWDLALSSPDDCFSQSDLRGC